MTSIRPYTENDRSGWDAYVLRHPMASVYHLSGWKRVIEQTYRHRSFYLLAVNSRNQEKIAGVFPLVHLKHPLFGNHLVSMPFFDHGGILADDDQTAAALQAHAVGLGRELGVADIEARYLGAEAVPAGARTDFGTGVSSRLQSHKVRMLLDLPESADELMKSFKAKLRSQIKKPLKEGLTASAGRLELLDDFYRGFVENMRDLGSPVHSANLIRHTLVEFADSTRLIVVYQGRKPLAGSVVVGFGDTLFNPWASSLRRFSHLAPNMLLYWTMLEDACQHGYCRFDFGRSTPEEGTFRFKQQWGAVPVPLYWQHLYLDGRNGSSDGGKEKFSKMIEIWQKLPVSVTRILGPRVRGHIAL
jgi:FemAB-related protein (PEP-CTERM system-associated)